MGFEIKESQLNELDHSLRACKRQDDKVGKVDKVKNIYTVAMGVDYLCLDIPAEDGRNLSKYSATLAHKVNHSFEPNTVLRVCWAHPVLGRVNMLVANTNILAGGEVTLDYGYDTSRQDIPAWYRNMYERYHEEKLAQVKKKMPWLRV